jgi:DNA polymerase-3 subunit delta'
VIVGDADRLVAQESSLEAANALLKVLEEPPADTILVLTSSVPEALLPTIRSRLVAVRVGRLRDSEVERFLIEQVGTPAEEAHRIAEVAEGSVSRALAAAGSGNPATRAAARFLQAVEDGPQAWAGEAMMQQPWGARGAYTAMLDQLAVQLRSKLHGVLQEGAPGAEDYLAAIRLVQRHRVGTQRNLNPQVGLAVLACDMAAVL